MDEAVALYDERGEPVGQAPRSRVREQNLLHAATVVIVRNSYGQVYVHRRTADKDVYPSHYDYCAGGVLQPGEDPAEGARREVGEELGVVGVELRPVAVAPYHDSHTRYWGFCYQATYDGPISWQPDEVAWGDWMTLEQLHAALRDPDWLFVPDTRELTSGWLADRLGDRIQIARGSDCRSSLVEGCWIDREPRRPQIADRLLAEAALMPWLAGRLPLEVPRPRVVERDPLRLRHPLVPGAPVDEAVTEANAAQLAGFLRALGAVPVAPAEQHGLRPAAPSRAEHQQFLADANDKVVPRLAREHRRAAEVLLTGAEQLPFDTVVHADLGPEHILMDCGRLSGVIAWGDAHVGDRARDLAWALYGTPRPFADAFARAYGVSDPVAGRAWIWYRLGPWYEVLRVLRHGRPDLVDSAMRGVISRL